MTTEGEVDVMRGIQDMGAGTKRKEDPSSSNPKKKQKTSVSHGSQGQGQGYQDQGQDGASQLGFTALHLPCIQVAQRCTRIFVASTTGAG